MIREEDFTTRFKRVTSAADEFQRERTMLVLSCPEHRRDLVASEEAGVVECPEPSCPVQVRVTVREEPSP